MIKLVKHSTNFTNKKIDLKTRETFINEFDLKCAFCETKYSDVKSLNIEHLIPQSLFHDSNYQFKDFNDNLICICHSCNMSQGNRYPVSKNFEPLILDPFSDNPEEHFHYDENGIIFSSTEKGNTTINTYNLNRIGLVMARKEELEKIKWTYYSDILSESVPIVNDNSQFAGMKRYFSKLWRNESFEDINGMENWEQNNPNKKYLLSFNTNRTKKRVNLKDLKQNSIKRISIHEINSTTKSSNLSFYNSGVKKVFNEFQKKYEQYDLQVKNEQIHNYYSTNRIIERVKIKNFKGIGYLDILLPGYQEEKAPWFMLLGENGTGKSTILKAISIVLMGAEKREELKLKGSDFIKAGAENGYISLYLSGSLDPITETFNKTSEKFHGKRANAVKVLFLAYGSTRILSYEDGSNLEEGFTQKIENLFNPYASLNTIKKFFIKIKEEEFNEVSNLLKRLLGLDNNYQFVRKNNNISLKKNNENEISLQNLSDGFQSMIALASDIIIILKQYWSEIKEAEGIVLIDELDLHLHPQWKMKIVTNLRESFPRVQFIATTHDPLCLRGLESNEINVVKKVNEVVFLVKQLPNIEGMQIDQILMANYFGLHSTYSNEYNELFNRYYNLLNKVEKTTEDKVEISKISNLVNKNMTLGNTKREQILFNTIDNYIAQETEKFRASDIDDKLKMKLLNILDSSEGNDLYD